MPRLAQRRATLAVLPGKHDDSVCFGGSPITETVRGSWWRPVSPSAELCQCDFTACCTIQQPTVSHHPSVLKQAGVVESEQREGWVYHRLQAGALEALRAVPGVTSPPGAGI